MSDAQTASAPVAAINMQDAQADADAVLLERRVIAFRPPALIAAMEQGGGLIGPPLEGRVVEAETLPARNGVRFVIRRDTMQTERVVAGSQLVALLIIWCGAVGIPLPAKAVKRLALEPSGALLHFTTSMQRLPRPVRQDAWRD
jgi:hypothetical protein